MNTPTLFRRSCTGLSRLGLLLAFLVLTSCFRPAQTVHFYVLASPQPLPLGDRIENFPDDGIPARNGPRVGILPVTLPGYLQQPQMVVRREGSVDIRREDYHRWGEDLGQGVVRVLSVATSQRLSDVQGVVMPLRGGAPVDMRLLLDVRRFEGCPGDQAVLDLVWTLQKDGRPLREGHFVGERAAGPDMASMVEALSALLVDLSEDLALGIRAVL